jgi:outer membrane receptor protein involved in Fe transport
VGGPRGATNERESTRGVLGVRGDFDRLLGLGSDWRWEVSHVYGTTQVSLGTDGLVSTEALFNGVRVEADPSRPGQFRCVDAAARAVGCVPINPFAPYTAEMTRYMARSAITTGQSELNSTVAFLSGNLLELPAGPLKTVAGAELRSFGGDLDYDSQINLGLTTGNQIGDVASVTTRTREFFAEAAVPVVVNKPFARSINLEGAYRWSSPSRGDNYSTFKLGGDWSPAAGVRFRLMSAKSVRTPVPGELSGIAQTFGVVNDPCTAARRNLNPIRSANCATDGVPANYAPPQNVEQSVAGLSGGNPNLTPETGRTLTYGVVWTPTRNVSVSIDRFEIKIEDIIRSIPRQDAVNTCYDTPSRLLCNQVSRGSNSSIPGATWVLTAVNGQLQNAAVQVVRGFDIEGRYAFQPNRFGSFELSAFATIYDEAVVSVLDGRAILPLLGFAGGSTEDQGFIRLTGAANLGWRRGKFSGNWNVRYIGSAHMSPSAKQAGFQRVPEHAYHNFRLSYAVGKDMEVYGGIKNLFDKNPPFFASGFSGTQALDTIPGYYDVFGRSYFIGARYRF